MHFYKSTVESSVESKCHTGLLITGFITDNAVRKTVAHAQMLEYGTKVVSKASLTKIQLLQHSGLGIFDSMADVSDLIKSIG